MFVPDFVAQIFLFSVGRNLCSADSSHHNKEDDCVHLEEKQGHHSAMAFDSSLRTHKHNK
jgi:hypothetical protein